MNDIPKYDLEDEKIMGYSKLTVPEKLQWPDDAMMFTELVFSDKEKKSEK
jgi:hypothetical protein